MPHVNKDLNYLLLIAAVLAILIQSVSATTKILTVPQGSEETICINLVSEDRVSIRFTVVGQTEEKTLNFFITDPHGNMKFERNNVGYVDYCFVCDQDGEYILYFYNESTEERHVTLNYEIQHYIFGVPQMLFLAIIIVLVCVGAVAAFVILGKSY